MSHIPSTMNQCFIENYPDSGINKNHALKTLSKLLVLAVNHDEFPEDLPHILFAPVIFHHTEKVKLL